jgi:sec-independent protein translocase protein TatA
MGEGLFQPFHILLIIAIALLVFGTGKFAAVGKGLGEGIRNFKTAMKPSDDDHKNNKEDKKEAGKEEEEKKS